MMEKIPGLHDVKLLSDFGQPNLNLTIDRRQAARFGINVADIQDAVQTAVGGNAVSQVLINEQRYDVAGALPGCRIAVQAQAIEKIRLLSPTGERVSLAQLTKVEVKDGAYDIYREGNSRYVAITFNVRGRDLGTTVEEAIKAINEKVKMPPGYHVGLSGEYESEKRAEARLRIIVPLTILVIFIILYTMFRSFKWAMLILFNVAFAPFGGLLALMLTGTYLSVSSGVGMLALFGVSVQTGVIMVEYINQLSARGHSIVDAAVEGAVLRLRPIMMTMLVATFGLLPAALSHDIGSDSQRPFAIVIVGGLLAAFAEHSLVADALCLDRQRGRCSPEGGAGLKTKPVPVKWLIYEEIFAGLVVAASSALWAQSQEVWISGGASLLASGNIGSPTPGGPVTDVHLDNGFRVGVRFDYNSAGHIGHEFQYTYNRTNFVDNTGTILPAVGSAGMAIHSLVTTSFITRNREEGSRMRAFATAGFHVDDFVCPAPP